MILFHKNKPNKMVNIVNMKIKELIQSIMEIFKIKQIKISIKISNPSQSMIKDIVKKDNLS